MPTDDPIAGLPGEALLRKGLTDFEAGHNTIAACLVAMSRQRLSRAGLIRGRAANPMVEPERELYRLLCSQGGDPYARYNALVRELVSFERALDHRRRRARSRAPGARSVAET
jgi:hypothetical protein